MGGIPDRILFANLWQSFSSHPPWLCLMSSLADLPELVGFFSYSREDDEDSSGALSALRERIQRELRGQLGRSMKTFRLWQDKEAIAAGKLWEAEIKTAVGQSAFFIPIITPTVVRSPYCRFELEAFLSREAELGRDDLVFPILYIKVPELEDMAHLKNDPVLSIIAKRQYLDWRDFRHHDVNSRDVKEAVERFCAQICAALRLGWLTPEERKMQETAAALVKAEAERERQEAETQRRQDEARREAAEAQASERAEQERRRREAEAELYRAETEQRRAEEQRQRDEAAAKRRADQEERRHGRRAKATALWQSSRLPLIGGSLAGLAILAAVGMWALKSVSTPVAPPTAVAPSDAAAAVPVKKITETQVMKPADTFKDCGNCPQMIVVPAGTFTMGSPITEVGREPNEGPQHPVSFSEQFAVGQFAVTFDEWDACVADGGCNGYSPPDEHWGRGRRPVINVSWDDAQSYVRWLSHKTGKPYRLLSEAEREYVTRAGTPTPFWFGLSISPTQANYNGSIPYGNGPKGDYRRSTMPVESFLPNPWGVFQVHGNVWEWTGDCWHDSYTGAPTDGSTFRVGDCKGPVLRGGSWRNNASKLRSAQRNWWGGTDGRDNEVGFRVGRPL
jgi:formylglycine-generating enzyme required for sulfatase activity